MCFSNSYVSMYYLDYCSYLRRVRLPERVKQSLIPRWGPRSAPQYLLAVSLGLMDSIVELSIVQTQGAEGFLPGQLVMIICCLRPH